MFPYTLNVGHKYRDVYHIRPLVYIGKFTSIYSEPTHVFFDESGAYHILRLSYNEVRGRISYANSVASLSIYLQMLCLYNQRENWRYQQQ